MRDKNYRRKQEAKHYNRRVEMLSDKNFNLLYGKELNGKEQQKRRKLLGKLRNGDLKFGELNRFDKKFSNKTRRHLQKTVDFILPSNIFLDRKHARPAVKGYNGDSFEEIWLDILSSGPFECGFFDNE